MISAISFFAMSHIGVVYFSILAVSRIYFVVHDYLSCNSDPPSILFANVSAYHVVIADSYFHGSPI